MGSRQLWILCAILFGLGLISQPIQYLFPKYMEDTLSQRLWIAGLLRAIPIGLGGISALLAGALCDRFGRKLTLVLGITGGFLVGFGARYAGGCTSGHAISGLSNLQLPSLIAVVGFFIGGLVMVH